MSSRIAARIGGNKSFASQWRPNHNNGSLIHDRRSPGLRQFLMTWRCGTYMSNNAMSQLVGDGPVLRQRYVQKEQSQAALGERPLGFALASRLQPSSDDVSIQTLQDLAVSKHLDLLHLGIRAREICDPQFVHEMNVPVRAFERNRSVLNVQ